MKLDLSSTASSCRGLVGERACLFQARTRVVPGDPENSFLYMKLMGHDLGGTPDLVEWCGDDHKTSGVMPPAGQLRSEDVDLVRAWIAAGASCGDVAPGLPDAGPPDAIAPDAGARDGGTPDACVPHVTELLANPVFDLTPVGSTWHQNPSNPAFPPITSDGLGAQSTPYKAWMGGLTAQNPGQHAVDLVYQDVVIPANTTQLTLTGYYAVSTQETTTAALDHGTIDLIQTNGTPIETVLSLSNLTSTNAEWTSFHHTFAATAAGQTVRLRMTSSNDSSKVSNFYFDTLSLEATHCQ